MIENSIVAGALTSTMSKFSKFSLVSTRLLETEEDTGCLSAADEDRRALLDERLRCFPVVLGAAGLHLVGGFHIKQLGQTTGFGTVQIALHQAKRDRRSLRQRPGEFHRDGGQLFIGDDPVDKTER